MELISVFQHELPATNEDIFFMVNESYTDFIPLHFHEEVVQLAMIKPGKVLLLWPFPQYKVEVYNFCPDQRIMTHRLIGKPALGPSPPNIYYNSAVTPALC